MSLVRLHRSAILHRVALCSLFFGLPSVALLSGCADLLSSMIMKPGKLTPAEFRTLGQAADCSRILPLTSYSWVSGELDEDDCTLGQANLRPRITTFAREGHRVDYHILKVEPMQDGGFYDIEMQSDYVDSRLIVMNKTYYGVGYDDDSGEGINSRLVDDYREGVYIIAATTANPDETGSYRLRVQWSPSDPRIAEQERDRRLRSLLGVE